MINSRGFGESRELRRKPSNIAMFIFCDAVNLSQIDQSSHGPPTAACARAQLKQRLRRRKSRGSVGDLLTYVC